jgi:tetrapyrrole methylase family protein/MazG family protein
LLSIIHPGTHICQLVKSSTQDFKKWEVIPLPLLEMQNLVLDMPWAVYVPASLNNSSLETFVELVAYLRSPQGCPWDREQTHRSLRQNLLEESYEVLDALDSENLDELREELGDLLLQIVLHAQIAQEDGEFNLADVVSTIHQKIVYRHPHVFGEMELKNSEEVIHNWEILKSKERQAKGVHYYQSILEKVPTALPALALSMIYQKRAARVGFDWSEINLVVKKVYEEIEELADAETSIRREEELGDLLFAVVNLARWLDVDAESALRTTNQRFKRRFSYIEQKVQDENHKLSELSLEEMDRLWEEAKREGL